MQYVRHLREDKIISNKSFSEHKEELKDEIKMKYIKYLN